jgi:hypothetical protein
VLKERWRVLLVWLLVIRNCRRRGMLKPRLLLGRMEIRVVYVVWDVFDDVLVLS